MRYEIKQNFNLNEAKPLVLTLFERKKNVEEFCPVLLNAFSFNNEIFVYDFPTQIQKIKSSDLMIAFPENKNELFEILATVFILKNGKGEQDIILFLETLLSFGFNQQEAVESVLNFIGKKASKQYDFYNWVLNQKKSTIELFMEKGISLRILFDIKNEKQEFIDLILNSIKNFSANTNVVKNFISWTREIVVRDNISFTDLTKKLEIDEILAMDLSQKGKMDLLMERLYQLRFPLWSEKKVVLKKEIDRLKSLSKLNISIPEFIEGSSIKVGFELKNIKDLDNYVANIQKFKDDIEKILKNIKE